MEGVPANGAAGEVVIIWNEDALQCVKVLVYLKKVLGSWLWIVSSGVYGRGKGKELSKLWDDLRECKRK